MASGARKEANFSESRSAIVRAKLVSASKTVCVRFFSVRAGVARIDKPTMTATNHGFEKSTHHLNVDGGPCG
jgi:hypothetical protein